MFTSFHSSLASCLQTIDCPTSVQSYGSLVVNLLHLLGSHHCQNNSEDVSCSHEKRSIILHNLLTHWTDNQLHVHADNYDEHDMETDSYCK
jgi:hypothetical protein